MWSRNCNINSSNGQSRTFGKENNVDAEVKQIKISEAASMQDGADLIVSTTILPTTYKIPAIIATSYITGMGMEELDEEILRTLNKRLRKGV